MRLITNGFITTARLCVAGVMLAMLAACQSPPPAPAPTGLSQEQQGVLRSLGFTEEHEGWTLVTPGRLLFSLNSDVVLPELRAKVDNVARTLHKAGIAKFRVEGHTDDQGAKAYNDELSVRRAGAVAQLLIDAGIPADQVQVKGYGFSRPIRQGTSDAARSENRRVAIVVPAL